MQITSKIFPLVDYFNVQYIREDSTAGVKKSYEDKFSAKVIFLYYHHLSIVLYMRWSV